MKVAQQIVNGVVDELNTIDAAVIKEYLNTNMDLVADEDFIIRLLSPVICQLESNLLYESYGYKDNSID